MQTKIVSKDNGYFEVIQVSCCDAQIRVSTENIQYGITARKRELNRQYYVRNHKCA